MSTHVLGDLDNRQRLSLSDTKRGARKTHARRLSCSHHAMGGEA
jgi:hypothetical protein